MKTLPVCLTLCAALAAALPAALPAHAETGGGVKVGSLSCHVDSGWGFVFGSSRTVNCTFSGEGRVEDYKGKITKFGVDIGYQRSGVMLWGVFAPTGEMKPGSLAGAYGGATAGASLGVGVGANALVGGSSGHFALQPLSVEGMTGVNIAGGIGGLTLDYVPNAGTNPAPTP
jgi:hypothetical protein